MSLAVVPVSISAEEYSGGNLAEAVEHALDPKVRGTGGPDRTYRGSCEHGNDCFGHVGHKATDAITGYDPSLLQRIGKTRDLTIELSVTEGTCDFVLCLEDKRRR